ncbi:hypothetical protein FOA52_011809 [Chlamydomonas sp. UWO 241]|nr:hypothetical protein FOA52_011809 [Chlamydomonas sp. UWO 241]
MLEQAPYSFPSGLRVLVVDDDAPTLKVVSTMLVKCSYNVTTATNGKDALHILRDKDTEPFELVLSDVMMPDMDGFRLLELIGLELDLPVIMMSSNGDTQSVLRGVTHGAVDYLIKPVRLEELRNLWQHVVRRRRDLVKEESEDLSHDRDDACDNLKKRKDLGGEDGQGDEESNASKRARVVWSVEMHQQFVNAVNQLGVDKAVPKKILEIMEVDGLTRENVASHLQKYRLYLKRVQGVTADTGAAPSRMPGLVDSRGSGGGSMSSGAAARGAASPSVDDQPGGAAAAAGGASSGPSMHGGAAAAPALVAGAFPTPQVRAAALMANPGQPGGGVGSPPGAGGYNMGGGLGHIPGMPHPSMMGYAPGMHHPMSGLGMPPGMGMGGPMAMLPGMHGMPHGMFPGMHGMPPGMMIPGMMHGTPPGMMIPPSSMPMPPGYVVHQQQAAAAAVATQAQQARTDSPGLAGASEASPTQQKKQRSGGGAPPGGGLQGGGPSGGLSSQVGAMRLGAGSNGGPPPRAPPPPAPLPGAGSGAGGALPPGGGAAGIPGVGSLRGLGSGNMRTAGNADSLFPGGAGHAADHTELAAAFTELYNGSSGGDGGSGSSGRGMDLSARHGSAIGRHGSGAGGQSGDSGLLMTTLTNDELFMSGEMAAMAAAGGGGSNSVGVQGGSAGVQGGSHASAGPGADNMDDLFNLFLKNEPDAA